MQDNTCSPVPHLIPLLCQTQDATGHYFTLVPGTVDRFAAWAAIAAYDSETGIATFVRGNAVKKIAGAARFDETGTFVGLDLSFEQLQEIVVPPPPIDQYPNFPEFSAIVADVRTNGPKVKVIFHPLDGLRDGWARITAEPTTGIVLGAPWRPVLHWPGVFEASFGFEGFRNAQGENIPFEALCADDVPLTWETTMPLQQFEDSINTTVGPIR